MRDGLTLLIETVADKVQELWPLLERHREELATDKARMILAPDVDRYTAMEAAGVMFAIVARDNGRAVGYSVNFVSQHLHYCAMRYAQNDVLYLDPEYRSGSLGQRLIDATEEAARDRECDMIIWHAKPNTALDRILPRRGYRVQDIMYSKGL